MSLFHRLGAFCARRRYAVVAVWAVLLLAALPFAPQLPGALSSGGFTLDDLEASRASQALASIGVPPSAMVIVIQSQTDATAGTPTFDVAAAQAIAAVPQAQHVTGILPYNIAPRQVSADGKTAYDVVALDLAPDDSPQALAPVEAALVQQPGLKIMLAGAPAFYGDIQSLSETDLRRSEVISLPLAALALLLVFGTVVAAGVPIVIGGSAVLIALGALFFVTQVTQLSIFVLNLATLLGLGLGVDYALLMTSRFREEMRTRDGTHQDEVNDAVSVTVGTAGRAVFFSGLTVLLGLLGLVLFEFMVLRSVGIAGAMVVALAVSAALTLLPAGLAILGPRIDAFPIRRRTAQPKPEGEGAWARLANRVMNRPVVFFVGTLLILLLLGTPFLHVRFNAPDATILPPNVPSRDAYDVLADNFGEGDFAPLIVAVTTNGPVTDPANVGLLYDYSRELAADPRVNRVEGMVDVDPRISRGQYQLIYGAPSGPADRFVANVLASTSKGNLAAFTVYTPYEGNQPEALQLVQDMRTPGSSVAPPAGLSVLVGGGAAQVHDTVARIAADFPRTAAFVLVTTYLVLMVLLRSVVLPLKAIVVNALSLTASFGALVWIFQDGNLSALLGFQPLGFVETTLPVILFCVLFGLSMDYEVFLLSRMKEVYDKTGDNRLAVARGMERSGRIVTSAAMIVVVVAGSFAFADIVLIKALGLGVAIAVALDATLVRALLVPSAMRLLGNVNWWMPARLKRLLPPLAAILLIAPFVIGCDASGRVISNPPAVHPTSPPSSPIASGLPDPQPIEFPGDEGPHDRLTEWWYFTGHLYPFPHAPGPSRTLGFEFVVFRAERGDFPVTWASHLALTDESDNSFTYDQRSEIGPQVDQRPPIGNLAPGPELLNLAIHGSDSSGLVDPSAAPWTLTTRGDGKFLVDAQSSDLGVNLTLDDATNAPVLHDGDGWVDFGNAGSSYYYSRPRMTATGTITVGDHVGDHAYHVVGDAWFDHQWGDFIAVGGGGWDWFAVNLNDGTDLTLSLVRAADGTYPLVYGTVVEADGTVKHLDSDQFTVTSLDTWTSPHTGATYPAKWHIDIPSEQLAIDLTPTVADQELDTRPTTGVVYWEGSQFVDATRGGADVSGQAYVELTGYAPANP